MAANPKLHISEGIRVRGYSVHWQASVDEAWEKAKKKKKEKVKKNRTSSWCIWVGFSSTVTARSDLFPAKEVIVINGW